LNPNPAARSATYKHNPTSTTTKHIKDEKRIQGEHIYTAEQSTLEDCTDCTVAYRQCGGLRPYIT
jgi:hypothetical protein